MTTLIGVNLSGATFATATNTTPVLGGGKGFTVGTRHTDYNGKEYIFVQSNSAVAAGDVVYINSSTGVAAGLTTATSAASEELAVSNVALASGEYGWVQVKGAVSKISCAGLAAKDVLLYSTTTAGRVDDATASNYQVTGIQLLSTNPSSTATTLPGFISYPKVLIRPGTA